MKKKFAIGLSVIILNVLLIASAIILWRNYPVKVGINQGEDLSVNNQNQNTNHVPEVEPAVSALPNSNTEKIAENYDDRESKIVNTNAIKAPDSSATQDPLALYDSAKTAFRLKSFDKALTEISAAIQMESKNPNFYILKAEIYLATGKKDLAVQTIDSGLIIMPGNELLLSEIEIINITN